MAMKIKATMKAKAARAMHAVKAPKAKTAMTAAKTAKAPHAMKAIKAANAMAAMQAAKAAIKKPATAADDVAATEDEPMKTPTANDGTGASRANTEPWIFPIQRVWVDEKGAAGPANETWVMKQVEATDTEVRCHWFRVKAHDFEVLTPVERRAANVD